MFTDFLVSVYLITTCCFLGLVSCKEESGSTASENFDASLDGIAVRPLPEMDLELAQRIDRENRAISSIEDVTTEEIMLDAESMDTTAPTEETTETGENIFGTGEDIFSTTSSEPNSI